MRLSRVFTNTAVSGWNSGVVSSNNKGDIVPLTGTYTTTNPSGYKVVSFTASGTLQVTGNGVTADILLVGGGGGGGAQYQSGGAGGGGAGGLTYVTNISIPAGIYPVIVGTGGAVSDGNWYGFASKNGAPGLPSAFYTYAVPGGGGGGTIYLNSISGRQCGSSGACGGGAAYNADGRQGGDAITGYGYKGGNGGTADGGGGGGMGSAGAAGSGGGGAGGSGVSNSITGSSVIYAAGGGGGNNGPGYNNGGSSNTGGRGGGNQSGGSATSPVANTGSGGGGGGGNQDGAQGFGTSGAAGIVIVRIAV